MAICVLVKFKRYEAEPASKLTLVSPMGQFCELWIFSSEVSNDERAATALWRANRHQITRESTLQGAFRSFPRYNGLYNEKPSYDNICGSRVFRCAIAGTEMPDTGDTGHDCDW